jgi:short-subunit dehydrogenase
LFTRWLPGVYGATKAYVLTLSQALQSELGPRGLYVQAVLPAASRLSTARPERSQISVRVAAGSTAWT